MCFACGGACFCAFHTWHGFQRFLDARLAVAAHHPFYFHRLFDRLHRFFLSFRCFGHFGCADLRCCYFLQICFGSDHLIFSGAPHIKQIQPERIGNDTDTAQTHGRSAKHRIQRETKRDKQAGGQRDADSIVEKCPEQILMDISQRGSAQADRCGHIAETALHQHDIGRIDGHIGPGTDRDADIRAGQGRRIIDPIAHHGNFALFLQLTDHVFFAVWQDPGDHFIHAGLAADRLCRAGIISGEHDHTDAHILQFADGLRTVFLDHIGNANDAGKLLITAEKQRSLSLFSQLLCLYPGWRRHIDIRSDKLQIAGGEPVPFLHGDDPVARHRLESTDRCRFHP